MNKRIALVAAPITAGLLGLGVGAAVFGPTTVTAQEQQAPDGNDETAPEGEKRHDCDGRHGRHGGPGRGAKLTAAAGALGITADELRSELRSGKSIAQIAEERGVDLQAVKDALVGAISARIDEKVAEGRITEEEAAEKKADLEERVEDMLNRTKPSESRSGENGEPSGFRGRIGPHGGGSGPFADPA